jgi:hypothetical protein
VLAAGRFVLYHVGVSRTVPNPKRSASFYRKNAKARAKKAAYDKAFNARSSQKKDRAEHGRARYAAKKEGTVKSGQDMVRGKGGKLRAGDRSKNRAAR